MLKQEAVTAFATNPAKLSGADYLGSGCFANVMSATIPGFVVKTVRDFWNDGWFAWALYCLKHQGEVGIPAILALRLDFTEGKLWALMEKLEPLKYLHNNDKAPYCQISKDAFQHNVSGYFGRLRAIPNHLKAVMDALPDQEFRIDLHSGNYMLRGSKVIVTDPFTLVDPNSGSFISNGGDNGNLLGLKWARETIDAFVTAGDPRVSIVGTPEEAAKQFHPKPEPAPAPVDEFTARAKAIDALLNLLKLEALIEKLRA